MKAVMIEEFGTEEVVKVTDLPIPLPQETEVQIAVAYAGVNPVDWKIREGKFKDQMPCQFPLILGWEASGTISATGKKADRLKKGDEVYVYCRKPTVQWGCWAEYLTVSAKDVALKPRNLSFAQAAAIPLAGLTAWQGLFDKARLQSSERILIHAGAGGVGGFAIQWAKYKGAHVITTASADKKDYVSKLGADEIIDYRAEPFTRYMHRHYPQGVDVVFDTVGGVVFQQSFEVIRPEGRLVSIVESAVNKPGYQVKCDFLFVSPNQAQLQEIASLYEKGKAIVPEIHEYPLEQAKKALQEIQRGRTKGKIVLKVQ